MINFYFAVAAFCFLLIFTHDDSPTQGILTIYTEFNLKKEINLKSWLQIISNHVMFSYTALNAILLVWNDDNNKSGDIDNYYKDEKDQPWTFVLILEIISILTDLKISIL